MSYVTSPRVANYDPSEAEGRAEERQPENPPQQPEEKKQDTKRANTDLPGQPKDVIVRFPLQLGSC